MQHPANLNTTVNRHIENQILANRKTLQTGMEFIPVSTHAREPSEFPTCCLDFVNEFVRITGVVLGYIPPYFIKVVFSFGGLLWILDISRLPCFVAHQAVYGLAP